MVRVACDMQILPDDEISFSDNDDEIMVPFEIFAKLLQGQLRLTLSQWIWLRKLFRGFYGARQPQFFGRRSAECGSCRERRPGPSSWGIAGGVGRNCVGSTPLQVLFLYHMLLQAVELEIESMTRLPLCPYPIPI